MADLFNTSSLLNYNENPPPDDNSRQQSNLVEWAKHVSKLADPLRVFIEAIQVNVNTAFDKTCSGGGTASITTDYTMVPTDQGRLLIVNSSDGVTITLLAPSTIAAPFAFNIVNIGAAATAVTPPGGTLINGLPSLVIFKGQSIGVQTDGLNYFTMGGYPTGRTGSVVINFDLTAPNGMIALEKKTLGYVGSGADYEGNIYQSLYTYLWTNVADAQAPVTGGRGASASDDWLAAKLLTMPGVEGSAICGIDPAGSRVSAASLDGANAAILGAQYGGETHTLTEAEMPTHSHTAGGSLGVGSGGSAVRTISVSGLATGDAGGGGAHTNTTPSIAMAIWITL